MTKEEFDAQIKINLTQEERILINANIHGNERHKEYNEKYDTHDYDWCLSYLLDHRDLLTFDHTPIRLRGAIREMLSRLRSNEKLLP